MLAIKKKHNALTANRMNDARSLGINAPKVRLHTGLFEAEYPHATAGGTDLLVPLISAIGREGKPEPDGIKL